MHSFTGNRHAQLLLNKLLYLLFWLHGKVREKWCITAKYKRSKDSMAEKQLVIERKLKP